MRPGAFIFSCLLTTGSSSAPWIVPAQGAGPGSVDSILPAKGTLSVGYGNGGAEPLQFSFDSDEQETDVGFFKLFLCSEPANFGTIAVKTSPFEKLGEGKGTRGSDTIEDWLAQLAECERELEMKKTEAKWGVKVATVIQMRE